MQTLRTPDEAFDGLPDFPFEPHYDEVDDGEGGTLRIHHLDEGPPDPSPVLIMHGDLTWCDLSRHVTTTLGDAGRRLVAPHPDDGGRRNTPTHPPEHTSRRHAP